VAAAGTNERRHAGGWHLEVHFTPAARRQTPLAARASVRVAGNDASTTQQGTASDPWSKIQQRCDLALAATRTHRRRIVKWCTRFLANHRLGIALRVIAEPFIGRPGDVEAELTVPRRIAIYLTAPVFASGLFGKCASVASKNVVLSMPSSSQVPGEQLVRLVDRVEGLAYCGGFGVALTGIYVLALADKAVTTLLWRLLSVVSPGGTLPRWPWFVWRTSSSCVYIAVLLGATGGVMPYLSSGAVSVQRELLLRSNTSLLVGGGVLLVLLHRLRSRNLARVNLDVWGNRWKATLATLLKMLALMATPLLLGLANEKLAR
jgi:hypothetical protein